MNELSTRVVKSSQNLAAVVAVMGTLTRQEARKVAKLAHPEWRGLKVTVKRGGVVSITGTYWTEGSRNTFAAVNLETGAVDPKPEALRTPQEIGVRGGDHKVVVPPGFAVVEHSVYCGQDAGCTVYLG